MGTGVLHGVEIKIGIKLQVKQYIFLTGGVFLSWGLRPLDLMLCIVL